MGRRRSGMPHVDLTDALNIFMRDFGGFGGIGDLFGGRGGPATRTGADIKLAADLTLTDVAQGVEKTFAVKLRSTPATRAVGQGLSRAPSRTSARPARGPVSNT